MRVICPASEPLGIFVCARPGHPPFAEGPYLHKLIQTGIQLGLRVIAFDPQTWNPDDNTVQGWTLRMHEDGREGGWQAARVNPPSLVYDRSWPTSRQAHARFRLSAMRLQAASKLRLLNAVLPSKWRMHELLSGEPKLSGLLVPTAQYEGPASLFEWLAGCEGNAFLKPSCGSQGRRVAAWSSRRDGTIRIRGRHADNRPFDRIYADAADAAGQLERWIGSRSYVMQPCLDLTADGAPCDIRALVQKNGRGRWTLTGAAIRIGAPGTVTANLHGGGTAVAAEGMLASRYGAVRAQQLMDEIRQACLDIVRCLECSCGRLYELGLDFGIERSGKLWFLEANSKPGRSTMADVSPAAAAKAVMRPLAYAKSILLRPPGRVIHEFDHL